jgi:AMMECR1 domain-containing protein
VNPPAKKKYGHWVNADLGLEPDAWKDKDTEILTFRAEVFSRKDLNR